MIRQVILSICTISVFASCTTYKEKFKTGTVADIGFFADSTVTMLGSLDLQQGRNEAILSRRFFDLEEPEEQLVMKLDQQFQVTIQNLVEYSIKIVNIAEGSESETNMVNKYVLYLTHFREPMVEVGMFDGDTFDRTLEKVGEQESFLDALRTAQPLLNAAAMQAILNTDELVDAVDLLARKAEARINEEYADIMHYREVLEDEKSDVLRAFELIYKAYKSDTPNLSQLKESRTVWIPELIPEGVPSRDDLANIVEHLEKRLDAMHRISEEVDPEWQDYLATQRELKSIAKRSKTMVQQAQILMLTWVRAHQKMAAGTVDPADWFDLGESTKALLRSAPGAVL